MRSKCQSMLVFVFSLLLALNSNLFAQNNVNPAALDAYNQGLHFASQGEIKAAINLFQLAVNKDKNFAEAYHRLAISYMDLGTLESKRKATDALEKALRLDGKNIQYQFDMARLLLKKHLKISATKQLKKVIKLDPTHAGAYYQLGLMKEDEMLWYKDLISPHEHIVFHFYNYAYEDLQEAEAFFKKAIELDSKLAEAYYHLALMQYELSDYASMAEYLQKAVHIQPANKNFFLFLGLSYERQGKHDSAYVCFNQAKHLMSSEERNLLESIEPLLNSEMKKRYTSFNDRDKNQYRASYWKQRDPFFITEFNERVLEHYCRFAYANLRFGNPEKGIAGWKTDQGKAFIRYGSPKVMYRTRPEMDVTFGEYPLKPSQEYWGYGDFKLTFEDEYLNRNFKFKRSINPEMDSKNVYGRLVKNLPEYYEPDIGRERYEIPHEIAQFMGEGGKTKIYLYYGIPTDQVSFQQRDDTMTVSLKRGIFVFDEKWQDVSRTVERHNYNVPAFDNLIEPQLMTDRHQIQLVPENYNIALEIIDEKTGKVGQFREEITVRAFENKRLSISDILLANQIHSNNSLSVHPLRNYRIIPNLTRIITPHQSIDVYFEIYNLQLNDNGSSRYRIETILTPITGKKSAIQKMASKFDKLFGKYTLKETQVSTSYEYFGNSTLERVHSSVQLADAKPGTYLLSIRATDLNGGSSVDTEVNFKIIN